MRMGYGLLLLGVGVLLTVPLQVEARISSAAILRMLDTDNDATVDAVEAKNAAATLFDRLDSDHDGTLDVTELQGRLGLRKSAPAIPITTRQLRRMSI